MNSIQYYDHITQELLQPHSKKIRELLTQKLIYKESEGVWKVLPIKGYNKRTYTLTKAGSNWSCNCQGFNTYGKCSHVEALFLLFGNKKQTDLYE